MDQQSERMVTEQHNAGYTSSSVIEVRLKTDALLIELRERLGGEITTLQKEPDGTVAAVTEKLGEPLINQKGVHHMMFFLQSFINTASVQGNFPTMEDYMEFLLEKRSALNFDIAVNSIDWDMIPENYMMVYHAVDGLLTTFLSRCIQNKERESYAATIKATEAMSTSQKKGLFG